MIDLINEVPFMEYKDTRGRWITQALFVEYRKPNIKAKYTLYGKDRVVDGETFVSMKKLYLDYGDSAEFLFVTEVLCTSWEHWEKIINNALLRPHIDQWRKELQLKKMAEKLRNTEALADNGNFNANKYLIEQGWKPKKEKIEVTKEEVEQQLEATVGSFLQRVK